MYFKHNGMSCTKINIPMYFSLQCLIFPHPRGDSNLTVCYALIFGKSVQPVFRYTFLSPFPRLSRPRVSLGLWRSNTSQNIKIFHNFSCWS